MYISTLFDLGTNYEWLASHPGHFIPGERAPVPFLEGCQPVASRDSGSISFEVMLPSACSFIVDGSLSYV
jgi:hypothetical protein